MIRVILAEDNELARPMLVQMFNEDEEMELVAEAADGLQLVAAVEKLVPDVVFTDIRMPEMDGLEATARIHKKFPGMAIVAQSTYDDSFTIIEMIKAGGRGLVSKIAGWKIMLEAVKAAFNGEPFYNQYAFVVPRRFHPDSDNHTVFNSTDRKVLELLWNNKDSQAIATELGMTREAYKQYNTILCQKAGVELKYDLLMYGIKHSLLDPGVK
jgi:DNA-binding NarL/FixJ family response regulator